MKEINILFSSKTKKNMIEINNETIECQILDESYYITSCMKKLKNILQSYDHITTYNIKFESKESISVLTHLHDILYSYTTPIILNLSKNMTIISNELKLYKDVVMDPNKNPDTYLKYILGRIPKGYKTNVFKISKDKKYSPGNMFPLTKSVGIGSSYNTYFVHIMPKLINPKNKNIYLIGKAVTFDGGGLNLKGHGSHIEDMKTDMTGSAIIISVLNLLSLNKEDSKYNIHLLAPIVENIISNTATRPGMVITTMNNRTVEIVNTDAEGRLCLADALEYINMKLIDRKKDNIIIDIATLTGNTQYITNGISCIVMGNEISSKYINKMVETGEKVGEYVDTLKLRPEYLDYLISPVADIMNVAGPDVKCGCIEGGTFLNYFADPTVPWIHMDVASNTFIDRKPTSYGINLLYSFIKLL
jgi:leucyl aminopeptidase